MELIISYLPSIISLACLQIIALISPGPDFAVIVRNSLIYSRKTALLTAFGISLGIMVHVSYTALGLGLIISRTDWLFRIFKYVGSSYLFYIGCKGILARKNTLNLDEKEVIKKDISPLAAVFSGFLTNALNSKAMLFFLSLFSVVVAPNTPALVMVIYSFIIFVTTLLWFSLVALCLSGGKTRKYFRSYSHWIDRITGSLLILIGIKLLFT